MSSERQIGLRKRTRPFTQVPNDVVDDFTIGYRELGLLVRILRMPEGFVIRSEQLSTEGRGKTLRGRKPKREGREAIRTALRNLALAGYYRLVRQRMLDGTFIMATDISEDPDAVWAAQALVFGGRPVPLVEQADGSFRVKYPDGTLLDDDVVPPDHIVAAGDQDTGDKPAEEAPAPKTGFRAPGNRAPGISGPGEPGSGELGALIEMVSKDGQQDSVPASQVRPGDADEGQLTIEGGTEPLHKERTEEQRIRDTAAATARWWFEGWKTAGTPIPGDTAEAKMRSLLGASLRAGYEEDELKKALRRYRTPSVPSSDRLQRELAAVRGVSVPSARPRGSRVNEHWNTPELVGAAATTDVPAAPKADRIRTEGAAW